MGSRLLTLKERIIIEQMARNGESGWKIAEFLNRCTHTIYHEFKRNWGRDGYDAHAAHERAELLEKWRLKKSAEGCRKRKKRKNKPKTARIKDSWYKRLNILEQKVEIITKILKELKDGSNN